MRITKLQLKRFIKEELSNVLRSLNEGATEEQLGQLEGMYFEPENAEHTMAMAGALGAEDQLKDIIDGYFVDIFNGIMYEHSNHDKSEWEGAWSMFSKQIARSVEGALRELMGEGFDRSFEDLMLYMLVLFPSSINPRTEIPGNPAYIAKIRESFKQLTRSHWNRMRLDMKTKISERLKDELEQVQLSGKI